MALVKFTAKHLKGSGNLSNKQTALGTTGETLAANHLCSNGYTILHRNYRSRSGEIDIIAREKQTLIFIEVKTRRTTKFGPPAAAVTSRKQAQISRVALEYLNTYDLFDTSARFDVVSIVMPIGKEPVIEIIKNAFELQYSC